MGHPVDQTMPALFSGSVSADQLVPLAQLGAGPDGNAVLARKGDRLVEVVQLNFGPSSPRWPALEVRLRAIAAIDHPAVRAVLGLDREPPTLTLEGDSAPPLAELVEQDSVGLERAIAILGELARAISAAHHVGIAHGCVDPWSVHVGASDRPRIELTGLVTRSANHEWRARCRARAR